MLETDIQKGWHDAIVEMYDIDLSPITGDAGDVFYFTNQLKEDDTRIQWKGNIYDALPIISAGYELNTTGQIAQPTLTVANIFGTFTEIIDSYDDLVGAKITRRRTFAKYLDGEPLADTLQEFPVDVFYIERKTQETALTITWQLGSVMDLEGLQLPRRVITQNHCLWRYRSSECGYVGAPVFNVNDQLISTTGQSAQAIAVINGYALNEQRYNEKTSASNVRNAALATQSASCALYSLLETRFDGSNRVIIADDGSMNALWSGGFVALSLTFRQGRQQSESSIFGTYYEIERWGYNAAGCSAATTALAAADAALATATANYTASTIALTNALAALPANDPLRTMDVCGKRIKSCQSRFPRQSIPFGAFPGANLSR
jgi:lambda family phage minor tail protein L